MKYTRVLLVAALAASAGCKAKQEVLVYQAIPVTRRDIVVSAQAAGSIQPDTTVDVKSLASGEVTAIKVQTGQVLQAGTLMVEIDRRQAKNAVDQSEAQYEQAKAQLTVAEAAKRRADTLFAQQAMTEADHDQAIVNYATARANLVTARVNNENNIIALSQTEVRAPITGMVISQNVDRGSMIAATGKDVSGGTTLFQMANMSLVQVHTLVDETDIGKIQAGQSTTVTVDAFPNRPFDGYVMKIEPRDTVSQNVTMFPVLVRIDNKDGLLRPGMNAEVEIHVGQRQNVLAAPNAALRTDRDYVSAAQVLNLDPAVVANESRRPTVRARPMHPRAPRSARPAARQGPGRRRSHDEDAERQRHQAPRRRHRTAGERGLPAYAPGVPGRRRPLRRGSRPAPEGAQRQSRHDGERAPGRREPRGQRRRQHRRRFPAGRKFHRLRQAGRFDPADAGEDRPDRP